MPPSMKPWCSSLGYTAMPIYTMYMYNVYTIVHLNYSGTPHKGHLSNEDTSVRSQVKKDLHFSS